MQNVLTNEFFFDIIICVTRKYPCGDAAMAQLVEHILGKDEVPGPNPGSSSRQPQSKHSGALVFYGMFAYFCGCAFSFLGLSWGATLASDRAFERSEEIRFVIPSRLRGRYPGSSSRQPQSKHSGALVFYGIFAYFCGCAFPFLGCLGMLLSLRTELSSADLYRYERANFYLLTISD